MVCVWSMSQRYREKCRIEYNRFNFNFGAFKCMLLCVRWFKYTLVLDMVCRYSLSFFLVFKHIQMHTLQTHYTHRMYKFRARPDHTLYFVICVHTKLKLYTKITCDGIYYVLNFVHHHQYTVLLSERKSNVHQTEPGKRLQKYTWNYWPLSNYYCYWYSHQTKPKKIIIN